jgi:hypothetical protein
MIYYLDESDKDKIFFFAEVLFNQSKYRNLKDENQSPAQGNSGKKGSYASGLLAEFIRCTRYIMQKA